MGDDEDDDFMLRSPEESPKHSKNPQQPSRHEEYARRRQENMKASIRRIVSCLVELDQKTDDIVSLILLWRTMLQRPLPFLVDGFNYLLKIRSYVYLKHLHFF